MKKPDFYAAARTFVGERSTLQPEWAYNDEIKRAEVALARMFHAGQRCMKSRAVAVVEGCVDRDPTLEKLAETIGELDCD